MINDNLKNKTNLISINDNDINEFRRDNFIVKNINEIKKQKVDNYKKILCKNINNIGKCIYNNKCLYAHSLDEQKVEPIRLIAYQMIKNNDDLSNVDLCNNRILYNTLHSLCKMCKNCADGVCTGGYNCKHGACNKKYVICNIDLNKGVCNGCDKIHLTTKGLIPYGIRVISNMKTKINIPKAIILNDDFFKSLNLDTNNNDNIRDSISNNSFNDSEKNIINDSNSEPDILNEYDSDTSNDSNESKKYDKLFHLLSINAAGDNDSFDELNFDMVSKKEEKLTKTLFMVPTDLEC